MRMEIGCGGGGFSVPLEGWACMPTTTHARISVGICKTNNVD